MLRAISVRPRDGWKETAVDSVVLDYDDRHRRRMSMTGVRGLAFLLDLPDAVMLRTGDALALEDGRLVEVVAAPEELAEIRCASPEHLVRVAWHLGNRHLPTQIVGQKLRIRRDHVIEEMVAGLGARVTPIEAPFDPEGGAYAQHVATQGHDHHDHDRHDHDHHDHAHHDHADDDHHHHQDRSPAQGHEHPHGHGHQHGHGCGCSHKHD